MKEAVSHFPYIILGGIIIQLIHEKPQPQHQPQPQPQ